jgi:CheY-like chemotaxis protein
MMSRTRLLLADDHLDTARQLCALLQPEFEVIGHVTDGRALVCDAARLSPDVIISDISMPGLDGITRHVSSGVQREELKPSSR